MRTSTSTSSSASRARTAGRPTPRPRSAPASPSSPRPRSRSTRTSRSRRSRQDLHGNDIAGLTGAGEQVTAVGGFVFDQNGQGIGSVNTNGFTNAKVRLFNTAPTHRRPGARPPRPSPSTPLDPDGFYFIRDTPSSSTLPYGIKYYVAVCECPGWTLPTCPLGTSTTSSRPRSSRRRTSGSASPTHLGFGVQPINGRTGRTLTPSRPSARPVEQRGLRLVDHGEAFDRIRPRRHPVRDDDQDHVRRCGDLLRPEDHVPGRRE